MIIDRGSRIGEALLESRGKLGVIFAYTMLVVVADEAFHVTGLTVPPAVPALLGTLLSILLGFRTNSAYERWWEARQIWGSIVNDSRTLARQVLTMFQVPEGGSPEAAHEQQETMVLRQAGWNYALCRSLRGEDAVQDLAPFLSPEEIDALGLELNVPNAILESNAAALAEARAGGYVDGFSAIRIDETLTHLCDAMGKCERIKNTTFPPPYSFLVNLMTWIFFLIVPLGLVQSAGWIAAPVAFVLGSVFTLIERLSTVLQNPFDNNASDTPMLALSRTIEINLRQQLGQTELPPKLEPVDGVLM